LVHAVRRCIHADAQCANWTPRLRYGSCLVAVVPSRLAVACTQPRAHSGRGHGPASWSIGRAVTARARLAMHRCAVASAQHMERDVRGPLSTRQHCRIALTVGGRSLRRIVARIDPCMRLQLCFRSTMATGQRHRHVGLSVGLHCRLLASTSPISHSIACLFSFAPRQR
jgi:hypothetical protein